MSRVWLITGCSRGLGRILAEEVLSRGDRLVAASRRPDRLADLRFDYGEQVHPVVLDMKKPEQACDAVRTALDAFGRLDVLVNNAGDGVIASIEDSTVEMFRDQFETNLLGVINVTRAALPLMRVQRSGIIMQVSSVCGRIGCPGLGAYQAAQWGVEGFSEALSHEVAPFGMKVIIIEPAVLPGGPSGSSLHAASPGSDYGASIGRFLETIGPHDGAAAGCSDDSRGADLRAVARTIIRAADEQEPPLRLLIGSDAYQLALENDVERLAETKKWKELSVPSHGASSPSQSVISEAFGSMPR